MKKKTLLFWDFMAKRYSKQPIADEAAYKKKLDVTQSYFRPDMEVFEFGCGTGSTAIIHAPFVNHILAIDGSRKMIEIAQEKADQAGIENVTFETATIDDFVAPDHSYDVVLGLSILHLLKNKEDALAKVYKLLKPGGIFVSSTVCFEKPNALHKLIASIGKWLGLTLKIFSAENLKRSITEAGFAIEYEKLPTGKGMAVFFVAKKNS